MSKALDVNWSEGLFILPHHFQQTALANRVGLSEAVKDYQPFYVGIAKRTVSEGDCENNLFRVTELECRMPDGTRLQFPGNCQIEARDFKSALDAHGGELEVFLGLPTVTELEPNTLSPVDEAMGGMKYRHLVKEEMVNDYNSGGNPQKIPVNIYNPKILFQGESQFGYDCLSIGVIERSAKYGSTPRLKPNHVPPCINVRGSDFLGHILRETGNRLLAKNRQLRSFWAGKGASNLMKAREALKVQTIATYANVFRQLNAVDRLHPFQLYMRMVELIGMLSIYSDDDSLVDPPEYDHNRIAHCFRKAEKYIIDLLALLEERSFESRVFEDKGELLTCPLEPAWLGEKYELYLCFESKEEAAAVGEQVAALKVSPENQMAVLNQRRLRGMTLEPVRHHPEGLPKTPAHYYYKLSRHHPLFARLADCPILAVWGSYRFSHLTTLYVVDAS